jgi:uncharacterized protein YaaR (DUF327 family)
MRDPFGVREVVIKGSCIIIGEQQIDDPALLSRCMQIELSPRNKTEESYKAMSWLRANAKSLSYVYYSLIKNYHENAKEFLSSVEATHRSLAKSQGMMADSRTPTHYAMIMAAMGIGKKVEEIINLQKKLLNLFTQSVEDMSQGSVLGMFFDDLILMRNMGEPVKDFISREMGNWNHGTLYLAELISLWLKFKQQHGGGRKFDQRTIRSYMKQQPFCITDSAVRRFKQNDKTIRGRACVIDLDHPEVPNCIKILFKHVETRAWDDEEKETKDGELDFQTDN